MCQIIEGPQIQNSGLGIRSFALLTSTPNHSLEWLWVTLIALYKRYKRLTVSELLLLLFQKEWHELFAHDSLFVSHHVLTDFHCFSLFYAQEQITLYKTAIGSFPRANCYFALSTQKEWFAQKIKERIPNPAKITHFNDCSLMYKEGFCKLSNKKY